MNRDELEFAISQYLDGTLPEEQRTAVEERLRADPEAAGILAEYRRLAEFIGGAAASGLPAVRWDRLADCVGQAIDDHSSRPILTIGRVGWAVAASVLIGVGIMLVRTGQTVGPGTGHGVQVAVIDVSVAEPAQADSAVVDVSVGQPVEADAADYASDGLLTRRPVVALEGFTSPDSGQIR